MTALVKHGATLAVYGFGHNLEKIRYPWRESLASALELADAVYFADCDSDDGTSEAVRLMEKDDPDLQVITHPWGTHHTIQAHIANALLEEIGERYDYALKLDMDEVGCEWTFEKFRAQLDKMKDWKVKLGRPHYTHFSPDFFTTFPFIYDSKAVISRTDAHFRYRTDTGGDACALSGADEYQTKLELFHYGKVAQGREREALYKEREFTKLYYELGFPDPKVEAQVEQGWLDYNKVFDVAKSRGDMKPFTGKHPVFVQAWIDTMVERSKQFWKEQYEQAQGVSGS